MRNRIIQFRAWDTKENKFFTSTYEAHKGSLEELNIRVAGEGRLSLRSIDKFVDESLFEDRFILEQFTGLKDKNGIEIYEGDIVVSKVNNEVHYKGVVTFKGGCFIWCVDDEPLAMTIDAAEIGEYSVNYISCDWGEVIGDIHQNPDLL